jgi:hypothetical protein
MSNAFVGEAQIWPWMRQLYRAGEVVMVAMNWSDRPDLVMHVKTRYCADEAPHDLSECGLFKPVQR